MGSATPGFCTNQQAEQVSKQCSFIVSDSAPASASFDNGLK